MCYCLVKKDHIFYCCWNTCLQNTCTKQLDLVEGFGGEGDWQGLECFGCEECFHPKHSVIYTPKPTETLQPYKALRLVRQQVDGIARPLLSFGICCCLFPQVDGSSFDSYSLPRARLFGILIIIFPSRELSLLNRLIVSSKQLCFYSTGVFSQSLKDQVIIDLLLAVLRQLYRDTRSTPSAQDGAPS